MWGPGEGVRASGDSAMLCTDLRLLGVLPPTPPAIPPVLHDCSLCLRPWRELGRAWPGERASGVTSGDSWGDDGTLSLEDSDRLRGLRPPRCCSARDRDIFLKRDGTRLFSSDFATGPTPPRRCLRRDRCRHILAVAACRLRPPSLMDVLSRGTALMTTRSPPLTIRATTRTWNRPPTASPFTCVIRSPARSPDSNAGLCDSTPYNNTTPLSSLLFSGIHLHFISVHFCTFLYISVHFCTFLYISVHFCTFLYISVHFCTFLYISVHFCTFLYISVHFCTFLYISVHFCTFLYISVHFCTFLYISVHFCTFLYISVHFCTFLYISVHFCTFLYISVHFCTFLYISVHFCTFLYISVHFCTFLYISVHFCTFLYISVHFCTFLYISLFIFYSFLFYIFLFYI